MEFAEKEVRKHKKNYQYKIEGGYEYKIGLGGDRGYYWLSAKVGDSHSERQLHKLGASRVGSFERNIAGNIFF